MAELLMECEEEELEPWQQPEKDANEEEEDDDEPIFVREISGSKTTSAGNSSGTQPTSVRRAENGTPARGANTTFQSPNKNYKPTTAAHNVANVSQPAAPMYQPVTRPAVSSAIVQPLPRPVGMQEPVRRPVSGGIPFQQPPRPSPVMQPICRPVAFTPNTPPVCRNITFPTVSQQPLRPVATIPAQPVMLNQGYIMTSPQVSANNSHNVMYALRPSATLTQYQGVQTLTTTGNATPLIRPLQPLHQIRPVSTPARTAPTFIHRSPAPTPSMLQNNLIPVLQQPLQQNSQKTQQTILTQSSSANIGRNENAPAAKRPATIDLTDDSPKRQKTNENLADNRPLGASPTVSTPMSMAARQQQTTPLQDTPTKVNAGSGSGTTPTKNGMPFPRACPKCNIHFNLLEPMKNHMRYCCPERMQQFFPRVENAEVPRAHNPTEENDKGKLIMLVSEFYYGKHAGDPLLVQQDQKTNTTFKCFSCQKVLKNNIRFMNHMKHHLELEKQSTESWENHTTCHHCYRQFPTPFQLQCHIESSHTLYESTTICKICELSFESEQILLQHMKDNHKPGEMPYVCQVCNYRSSVFNDIDVHFRNVHENTKNLLCPFCLKVIKSGTPYMQHYMKHQNKGVYRCAKCRLQFLSCKEKMDHRAQHHRTFRKPKQLEGLPPGTKVTIRATSAGNPNPVSPPTTSICRSPPSTPPQPIPKIKTVSLKNNQISPPKVNILSPKPKSPPKKSATSNTTKRIKMTNTALRNIRYVPGFHNCIECHRQVVDFEGHFHTYVHCSKCKFSTSCNKAYTSHMQSFHGRNSSKKSKALKKHPKDKRRITVVCLNCDFLTDLSGLDDMAKHLSESHTHSCQVVTENVSIFSSTHEGDMSKSRLHLPVEQVKTGNQEENTGSVNYAVTVKSIENKLMTEATKNESDACENSRTSQGQRIMLLVNSQMTSLEHVDVTTESSGSCSPNPEEAAQLMETESSENIVLTEESGACKDTILEIGEPSDNEASITDVYEVMSSPMEAEDWQDLNPSNDSIGIEQFLRRDAADSVSSDVSEPSSLPLDPLTPSVVLEHETTEILQKGTVNVSSQTGSNGEKAEEDEDSHTNISMAVQAEKESEIVL
ncbi:PREDICTED: zinc finger protein 280D [Nanorana parkeri]|uniref:zinc finger protein 280D n=1 Tax=Nanorana parkeri TaxID=125878 RepID=UPI000854FE90|nr:PREDICTED: zinc finger protein 280D [Nanorana parkeri]